MTDIRYLYSLCVLAVLLGQSATARSVATCRSPQGFLQQLNLRAPLSLSQLAALPNMGRIFFVAPDGNDAADGLDVARPFKTVGKCMSVIVAGDACILRAGTYREKVTFTKSGTADRPIYLKAYPGELPILSGTDPVPNLVGPDATGIYTAGIATNIEDCCGEKLKWNNPNQVYFNGQRMSPATFPGIGMEKLSTLANTDKFRATGGSGKITDNRGTTSSAGFFNYVDATGKSINMLLPPPLTGTWSNTLMSTSYGYMWGVNNHAVVTGIGGDQVNYTAGHSSYAFPQAGNYFYLYGRREFVNYPGAAFLDRATTPTYTLSFIPPENTPVTPTSVEIKKRKLALVLKGVSYLEIEGIKLFAASIQTDAGTHHVHFNHLTVHYADWPIDLWYGGNSPNYNTFKIHGNNNIVENSEFAYSAGAALVLLGVNHIARNNTFIDIANLGGSAIQTHSFWETGSNNGGAEAIDVIHNTAFNSGGSLIGLGVGFNVFLNDVYNGYLQFTDSGLISAVSMDGKNSEVAYNFAHDHRGEYNSSKGYWGPHEIYLDIGTRNFAIHHNVTWGPSGYGVHLLPYTNTDAAFRNNRQVYNNTSLDSTTVRGNEQDQGNVFANNFLKAVAYSNPPYYDTRSNLLITNPVSDFVNVAQQDFTLAYNSTKRGKGVIVADQPCGESAWTQDVGAIQGSHMTWFPGAMVREVDLQTSTIRCQLTETYFPTIVLTCDVGAMTKGRRMPLNLEVSLEDGTFLPLTVANSINYGTHVTTARLQGSLPLHVGLSLPLTFRVGAGNAISSPTFTLDFGE